MVNRKPRKRVNRNVPAKGRLREMADRLWSLAIRSDWAGRCAVCNATNVEAHHLVPRQFEATRYDLNNGICLCSRCHQFDENVSPHQNAAAWLAWLNNHWPARAQWYMENRRPMFEGTKNAAYYIETIRRLQQYVEPLEFEQVCGVRFAAWLEETKEEDGDGA